MGCPLGLAANFIKPTFKSHREKRKKKIPKIPTNIIHTCHVGFHLDFSYTEVVVGCGPKLPLCKPKAEVCDTLNQ